MHDVVFFLLGEKGYQVLRAAVLRPDISYIRLVVVGDDKSVEKDFSHEIQGICLRKKIKYCARDDASQIMSAAAGSTAVAAGWRWLLKEQFAQLIVFHDSLLPNYRGFNPLVSALLNKDSTVGVTVILASNDFDRGDIVAAKSMQITYPVKIKQIISEVAYLYFELSKSILNKVACEGLLSGTPQDEFKSHV